MDTDIAAATTHLDLAKVQAQWARDQVNALPPEETPRQAVRRQLAVAVAPNFLRHLGEWPSSAEVNAQQLIDNVDAAVAKLFPAPIV